MPSNVDYSKIEKNELSFIETTKGKGILIDEIKA